MPEPVSLERARAAKRTLAERLRGVEEVNGIGLTRVGESYALKVNCERAPAAELPTEIEGVSVVVEVVGKIRPR